MNKILIVEDDKIINSGIRLYLENQGEYAESVYSINEAETALKNKYCLIILDINLPDGSGLDLCKKIREKSNTPIIFLTANDTEENIIKGFEYGCDDYISKPFSIDILYQRSKAILRRSDNIKNSNIFEYKDLRVDFDRMTITLKDETVKLSATEYKILEMLIKNQGQVLTRTNLLEKIWDIDGNFIDENTLSVHIKRLRQKLNEDSKNQQYIITVFGIGYTFGD